MLGLGHKFRSIAFEEFHCSNQNHSREKKFELWVTKYGDLWRSPSCLLYWGKDWIKLRLLVVLMEESTTTTKWAVSLERTEHQGWKFSRPQAPGLCGQGQNLSSLDSTQQKWSPLETPESECVLTAQWQRVWKRKANVNVVTEKKRSRYRIHSTEQCRAGHKEPQLLWRGFVGYCCFNSSDPQTSPQEVWDIIGLIFKPRKIELQKDWAA